MIVKVSNYKKMSEKKYPELKGSEFVEAFELYSNVVEIHRNHNTFDKNGKEIDNLMLITTSKNNEAIAIEMGREGRIVYVMNDEGKTIERLA